MTAVPAAPTSGLDTQSGAGIPALMDALVLHGPGALRCSLSPCPSRVPATSCAASTPWPSAGPIRTSSPGTSRVSGPRRTRSRPVTSGPARWWRAGAEAGAHGWAPGQRVAGTSHAGCGLCRACRTGRYNLCESYGDEARGHRQYGHYSPGACAQYVVQHVNSVFRLPDGLSLEAGALLDPASIALHTVKRAEPAPGDTVVVVGPVRSACWPSSALRR